VGVIVFTGAGDRAFCVAATCASHPHGGREAPPAPPARPPGDGDQKQRQANHRARHGYCIGGGNELNVLCDLTISAPRGASARPGQDRLGAAVVGCQLLPAVVGEKKAREILYLTRQYSAEEALAMGW